ncbi:penicillin-binding transpeptidase domain-containing protein [Kibdelosporangium aridum]|uniref:NTF2-like N-terminal transpeptidase domain-containing protein n=1 Tax=Kibdelosporangium aridum TaxID=2030 RepID=A0A1Y5XQE0_KIBAR|nr:penicillin-binding transpeptidase domain-containing protein [Kibdelosporangium aridum]SMD10630.1 NTF2-like N-terminal transpeptidase domain-containing protein [Kibdelosporangium aridum]
MTDGKRRAILIGGALAAVAIIVAGVFVLWPSSSDGETAGRTSAAKAPTIESAPPIDQVLSPFLTALAAGKAAEAAALTDNPAAAQEAITALYKGVDVGSLSFARKTSTTPQVANGTVTVPVEATLQVTGASKWTSSWQLAKTNDKWLVKWAPTVIHPKLQAGQTLAVLGEVGKPNEAAVLDETGATIAKWEGSKATPTDPKISPRLMNVVMGGASSSGTTGGRYIAIVDAAGKEVGEPLFGQKPKQTTNEPVHSTLNGKIAIAAQNAVDKASQPTMLVAIKPSTGGILAVAQNEAASGLSALSSLYAPGSSFKIISAAAALQQGLTPESPVECPGTKNIGGRSLKNADFELGTTKLRTAFAKSCNTTFGELASKLPADGLRKAADEFGLNADFDIPGIKTELGKVENADSAVQRAEDSIGQGKIVATPLGMAVVAATVAGKKTVTPKLRMDAQTQVLTGYRAPQGPVLEQIRTMMRDVVTSGTATALSKFGSVYGKTGTAETESQGDNANGWFVGFRGDVAFAVVVVDSKTSTQAVNVTASFLSGF